MPATAPKTADAPRRSRAEQREETRARILQAALDIIIDEGIRSVRNRAVARRAGVSLGSTTYHFESIEDLIISAFGYWRSRALLTENPFYRQTSALLEPYRESTVPGPQRAVIAGQILDISVGYLVSQLSGKRRDRLLELAFHHESVRYPSLHKLVMDEWRAQFDFLAWVHRTLGSPQPDIDARLTTALFRQLEQSCVIEQQTAPDRQLIRASLHRHLSLCLGVDIPASAGDD